MSSDAHRSKRLSDEFPESEVFEPGPAPTSEFHRIQAWSTFALLDQSFHDQHHASNSQTSFDENNGYIIPLWLRDANDNIVHNMFAAIKSIYFQNWSFHHFTMLFLAVGSTVMFSYAPGEEEHFDAKLDFQFLFTSFMYHFTFLTRVTFQRRETAMGQIAKIKSLLCQIELGVLIWNHKRQRPSAEFEAEFCSTLVELAQCFFRLLELPTQPDYVFGSRHQRHILRKRTQQIRRELTVRILSLHLALEDCKASHVLASNEASRLENYANSLQMEMERVQLLKQYRTPQTARQFVTAHLLICPTMWGLYFTNIGLETGFPFTLALTVVSISIALLFVNMMQALEDPFLFTDTTGESIRIRDERKDTIERLRLVRRFCCMKLHPQQ